MVVGMLFQGGDLPCRGIWLRPPPPTGGPMGLERSCDVSARMLLRFGGEVRCEGGEVGGRPEIGAANLRWHGARGCRGT